MTHNLRGIRYIHEPVIIRRPLTYGLCLGGSHRTNLMQQSFQMVISKMKGESSRQQRPAANVLLYRLFVIALYRTVLKYFVVALLCID